MDYRGQEAYYDEKGTLRRKSDGVRIVLTLKEREQYKKEGYLSNGVETEPLREEKLQRQGCMLLLLKDKSLNDKETERRISAFAKQLIRENKGNPDFWVIRAPEDNTQPSHWTVL